MSSLDRTQPTSTPHRRTPWRSIVVGVSVALIAAACGSTSPGVVAKRSDAAVVVTEPTTVVTDVPVTDPVTTDAPPETDSPTTDPPPPPPSTEAPTDPGVMQQPGTDIPLVGPFPFDPNKPPQPFDGLMVATVNDLVAWWGQQMPQVFGTDYVPLGGGVFPAYPGLDTYPQPGCFSTYAEVTGNGYYCPVGDYIVWDDVNYALPNYNNHGSGAVTGLMSHEWGHAIQARTGVYDVVPRVPLIVQELQADCYSGAWFAHIARGESEVLSFTDADIRSGLIDTAVAADPVGTTPDVQGAHGAGFDRVSAFQDGFVLGVGQCATYATTFPSITEIGFTDQELATDDPGDLTYAELIDLVPTDLNTFWQSNLSSFAVITLVPFTGPAPTCGAVDMVANTNPLALYCPDTSTVYLDEAGTQNALASFGDFGPGYLLATAWGEAVQVALESTLVGEGRVLYSDCLVGVWTANLRTALSEDRPLAISAGDLDEAIATAIALGDNSASDNIRGDSFAKVAAFRTGVLGGRDGCDNNYG